MTVSQELLDLIVCPDCHGSLVLADDSSQLTCQKCGLVYPVRDGIPVLLVDEARRD
ncbi:Trm112 family protein [Nocardioides sp. SYSU D00038]|uniref:Trm112 family protein n=1 Tax=Nocardioides sp. SYSU D00038 TaxID=2812554 RepID=UPI001967E837|nr:Trm112 family protein [Nocardioides sp. SYSU D00038]